MPPPRHSRNRERSQQTLLQEARRPLRAPWELYQTQLSTNDYRATQEGCTALVKGEQGLPCYSAVHRSSAAHLPSVGPEDRSLPTTGFETGSTGMGRMGKTQGGECRSDTPPCCMPGDTGHDCLRSTTRPVDRVPACSGGQAGAPNGEWKSQAMGTGAPQWIDLCRGTAPLPAQ